MLFDAETANIPTSLEAFLYETKFGSLVRDLNTLHVSFGTSTGSFYATDGSSWRWDNLPPPLQAALLMRRGFKGAWRDPPRLVSLGADGDFILLTVGNGYTMQLTKYPELDATFDEYIKTVGKGRAFDWIHVSIFLSWHPSYPSKVLISYSCPKKIKIKNKNKNRKKKIK